MNTANYSVSFYAGRNKSVIGILFLLILLKAFTVNAQSTTTISGTIENPTSASVLLSIDRLHLNNRIEANAVALSNGQFQFTPHLNRGDLLELIAEGMHLKL